MGRKRTINRMAMRGDYEGDDERQDEDEDGAAEDEEEEDEDGSEDDEEEDSDGDDDGDGGDDDEDRPKKKKKKKAASAPVKPRARTSKQVRMKVVWGVFNNSNQQLATYPYPQESDARAHAERLTTEKKTNHFVQKVKVPFDEK